MSKTTIIYAHPYEKSFNHAILERVQALLDAKGQAYQLIDLYADGFNPVFTKEELALFAEGKALDPLVLQYQEALKESNRLIFIFPIWWANMPAIVKGFIDKVFLRTFAGHQHLGGAYPLPEVCLWQFHHQGHAGPHDEGRGRPSSALGELRQGQPDHGREAQGVPGGSWALHLRRPRTRAAGTIGG